MVNIYLKVFLEAQTFPGTAFISCSWGIKERHYQVTQISEPRNSGKMRWGDGTHRPTVLRTLLLLYLGPFLQAQLPESHWNILYFGEGKKLYNNLRSVVLQLFLLLNLELSVDTSLSITWWNVLSEELERFVHVWANDTIYILMIFWEIMLLVCWRRWRRRGHSRWSGLHAKQREKRT